MSENNFESNDNLFEQDKKEIYFEYLKNSVTDRQVYEPADEKDVPKKEEFRWKKFKEDYYTRTLTSIFMLIGIIIVEVVVIITVIPSVVEGTGICVLAVIITIITYFVHILPKL